MKPGTKIAAAIEAAVERHVQRRRLELARAFEKELIAEARRFPCWLSRALGQQPNMADPWGEVPLKLGKTTDLFKPWVQRYADEKVRKGLPLKGFVKTGGLLDDLKTTRQMYFSLYGSPQAQVQAEAVHAKLRAKLPGRKDIGALPIIGNKLSNPKGSYRPAVEAFARYWSMVAPRRALERAKRKVFRQK